MKALKIFTFVMAAAMMFSCTKDGQKVTAEETTVVLKISTEFGATRAVVDEVVTGYETPINNGYVFFADATQIYHAGAINTSEIVSTDGQQFSASNLSTRIYVLVNVPAGFTAGSYTTVSALLAATQTVASQNATTTGNGLTEVMMYGTAAIDYTNKVTVGSEEVVQVEAALTPAVARIEFEGIGLTSTSVIKEYTLAGIYLDNFFPSFTTAGTASGTQLISMTNTELTGRTGYDWAKDAGASAVTAPTLGSADITAGTDQVWAYQVAAGDPPRIILHITDIVYDPDGQGDITLNEDRFVTVTGWNDSTSSLIGTFDVGNVYHAENILFDFDDLTRNPNPGDIDLYVKVTTNPWVINLVTPVL